MIGMKYKQMVMDIHDQILRLIALKRLIKSERFQNLYRGSSYDSQETVECVIYKGDLLELQRWMNTHPNLTLEDLTIRQLHVQARKKRVKNYAKFSKCELIKELL